MWVAGCLLHVHCTAMRGQWQSQMKDHPWTNPATRRHRGHHLQDREFQEIPSVRQDAAICYETGDGRMRSCRHTHAWRTHPCMHMYAMRVSCPECHRLPCLNKINTWQQCCDARACSSASVVSSVVSQCLDAGHMCIHTYMWHGLDVTPHARPLHHGPHQA